MDVRQIAIYGKGGIGKSVITSNISMALHEKGLNVMQVGCDPKRDSTRVLVGGRLIPTVLEKYREEMRIGKDEYAISLEDIVFKARNGIYCVESGGPEPGIGCAGRGVLTALQILKDLDAFGKYEIDVAIYDVLGDVVCRGFAMPMRKGYAREIYIVVSGELMALYAANNICKAIKRFAERSGIRMGGIICNSRNVKNEEEVAKEFSERIGSKLVHFIPRDDIVQSAEINRKTVVEYAPESNQTRVYRDLADEIIKNKNFDIPTPMEMDELERLMMKFSGEAI
jgi:nitrogenase iron protein NifH